MNDPNSWSRLLIRLALAGAAATLVRLTHPVRRVVVQGVSMLPAFAPGDRLLVVPAWRLRPGDVIAVADPRQPSRLLVKRVASVDDLARMVKVLGDNRSASTDSRVFGPVARHSIVGRAVYRYGPAGREGRLEGHWWRSSER